MRQAHGDARQGARIIVDVAEIGGCRGVTRAIASVGVSLPHSPRQGMEPKRDRQGVKQGVEYCVVAFQVSEFVGETPWIHVDIAGPASTSNPRPSQPKGGTGFAVATIVEYATTKH